MRGLVRVASSLDSRFDTILGDGESLGACESESDRFLEGDAEGVLSSWNAELSPPFSPSACSRCSELLDAPWLLKEPASIACTDGCVMELVFDVGEIPSSSIFGVCCYRSEWYLARLALKGIAAS